MGRLIVGENMKEERRAGRGVGGLLHDVDLES